MHNKFVNKNSLVLGPVIINEKNNEIKAIPELLELLYLNGVVII